MSKAVKAVFFVNSRKGFEGYLSIMHNLAAPLWISAGVLSETELELFRENGVDVTEFCYAIGVNENEIIDDAIETIREHHPDEVIWVQR